MQRKGDDASDPDFIARLFDALSIDPDVPGFDHALGERSALHEPDAVEISVYPHFFRSFASSANAWDPPERRSVRGARRPRQRQASPARVKPTSSISRAIASSSRPIEVAKAVSTGSAPPAERTLRAWLARRSARSIRIQVRP